MSSQYDKIVLISLDTLRADCIASSPFSLYKNQYKTRVGLKRSRLDDLLNQAAYFCNTVTAAPYTSAAHAAYFTGKWQKNNGVYDQFNSKLKAKTIFEFAHANGYTTIFKTDFPLVLGKYLNFDKGVDHYFIEDDEAALNTLNNSHKTLALFHFAQIHYPYGFHSLKYAGQDYRDKVYELERKYGLAPTTAGLEDMAIETFRSEEDLKLLFRYKNIVAYLYKHRMDDDLFNLYLEGINYFHEHKLNSFLDRLLTHLEGKRYLVVIFGDHGEAWDDDTYGHHNSSNEGVLRVPLLFYANDLNPRVITSRVRSVDLLPTLLPLMGARTSLSFDGKSLAGSIYDLTTEPDRDAFSAVWVNELSEIIRNTDNILAKGSFKMNKRHSIRYSACYYEGSNKFIRTYKVFADRSEVLVDHNSSLLYKLDGLSNLELVNDPHCVGRLQDKIDEYNNIQLQQHNASGQLREYFKLQGYNV